MALSKVFNISVTNSFAEILAEKLLAEYAQNPLELSDVLILLPNRRACKTLSDAFVRLRGMMPTLLPRMVPLGDVDEDEIVLSGTGAIEAMEDILPSIDPIERTMLFMKIILSRPQEFGAEKISLSQACSLAQELGRLIDASYNENLDFANLQNLVPEEYAGHWQETLKFLEIITTYWPQILKERGLIDVADRRNKLILQQAKIWEQTKPEKRIIVAATTATYPAMRELVRVVSELPNGEVILSGLDKFLDDESWQKVDETHPQFELKQLLENLNTERKDVQDFVASKNVEREKLLSEIMRPAVVSDKWRDLTLEKNTDKAIEGIKLLNCADVRNEALSIAILMREALETPEKTAALVTPDRNLARRVAAELGRWNIKVDDTAGIPLAQTPLGVFMRLVARAAQPNASRIELLGLLKHQYCMMGKEKGEVRNLARKLEKEVWRNGCENEELNSFLLELQNVLLPLSSKMNEPTISLKELMMSHIKVAETISSEELLWKGDAGQAATNLLANVMAKADVLGEVDPQEYLGLFETLSLAVPVRPKFGTHPRLKILGPIEARLHNFDVMILGEFNEGVWPAAAASDPWMSRPMKKDMGFPLPEKSIGILALDFVSFIGAKNVYLTRANKANGAPMLKSRWWMRMETVLKAMGIEAEALEVPEYELLAKNIDEPISFERIKAPAPKPPLKCRPRELSASGVELLMRDPYSVFAKYILGLKKLNEINPELQMSDFGNIIHELLEDFNSRYPSQLPKDAKQQLLAMGAKKFADNPDLQSKKAFWWPKFEKIIEHLLELEESYRPDVVCVHNEVKGRMSFDLPGGEFVVTAKADRVDETKDGKINIIDYKTGKARSVKEVTKGFAPQLPIEGLIAEKGGFSGVEAAEVEKLIYWQLSKKDTVIEKGMSEILQRIEQNLRELLNLFDFETTAYICHPNPKKVPEYSDYEHLARVKEWYVNEGEDD